MNCPQSLHILLPILEKEANDKTLLLLTLVIIGKHIYSEDL